MNIVKNLFELRKTEKAKARHSIRQKICPCYNVVGMYYTAVLEDDTADRDIPTFTTGMLQPAMQIQIYTFL